MADLLEKFDTVSVSVDNRITTEDRMFCECNQAAYETAIFSYQELSCFWEDMEHAQNEYKSNISDFYWHDYLHSKGGPDITRVLIRKHIHALHRDFIHVITHYFCRRYKITVNDADIIDALVPKEPAYLSRVDDSKYNEYLQTMQDMRVQYQDVVDQIMLRLDGRSMTEQSFYELHRKCQNAAHWANDKHDARYERKKEVLRLRENYCSWRAWPYDDWNIYDNAKELFRGLAHFETGLYDAFPDALGDLIGWKGVKTDLLEFPSCKKLKQIKLFKNGRIDIRFTSAFDAEEFVRVYLAVS